MKKNLNLVLGLAVMSMALAAGGCGGGHAKVTIIEHGGYYGYYNGTVFCTWANDYCGTGLAYGITDDGLFYGGYYASYYGSSGGSTGVVISTGVSSGGSSGGSTGTSTGTTSTGSSSTGTSTGTTSTGSSSTGSSGSYSSGSTGSNGSSFASSTKDVDLQRSALHTQALDARAGAMASQYQMSFEAARQLSQLADQMQQLSASGQMTDLDRSALAQSALGVVGISNSDVAAAMARASKGDKTAYNGLMDKAAANLGMPSSAALRDQILPSLGISAL